MLLLIRLFNIGVSGLLTAALMFGLPVFLGLMLMGLCWKAAIYLVRYPYAHLHSDLIQEFGLWAYRVLERAPSLPTVLGVTGAAIVAVSIGLWVMQVVTTRRYKLKKIFGSAPVKMKADFWGQEFINQVMKQEGMGPARLMLVNDNGIAAYSINFLIGRHVVLLSRGMFRILTPEQIKWVIAHEIAHIKYRDNWGSMAWQTYQMSLAHLFSVLNKAMGCLYLVVGWIPLVGRLFATAHYTISLVGRKGFELGAYLFKLIDSRVRHRMEFRADRYACELMGAKSGIQVMELLRPLGYGNISMVDTHPSFEDRIAALIHVPVIQKAP